MNSFFKKLLDLWMKFAYALGDFISSVFLTVFYFTIFAIVAIPYKIANGSFRAPKRTNWTEKKKTPASLEEFQKEY